MKKSILFLAAGFIAITVNAQKMKEKDVPTAVNTAFTTKYPKTEAKSWERENANFEVEFDYNKTEMSLLIDPNGKIIETETEIKPVELPKAVNEYCAKNVAGKKIKEASKITDDKGTVTYEAEIDETDYIFDANGAFIKKEVEKDGDKDEKKK